MPLYYDSAAGGPTGGNMDISQLLLLSLLSHGRAGRELDEVVSTAVLASMLQGCAPYTPPVTTSTSTPTTAPPAMAPPAFGLNNPLLLLLLLRSSGLRGIFDDRGRDDRGRRWDEEEEEKVTVRAVSTPQGRPGRPGTS